MQSTEMNFKRYRSAEIIVSDPKIAAAKLQQVAYPLHRVFEIRDSFVRCFDKYPDDPYITPLDLYNYSYYYCETRDWKAVISALSLLRAGVITVKDDPRKNWPLYDDTADLDLDQDLPEIDPDSFTYGGMRSDWTDREDRGDDD